MCERLKIAAVLKPQGICGEIKVGVYTDSADNLTGLTRVYIDDTEYKILKTRASGAFAYLTLKGVADRNAAELLRGKDIYALREDMPRLPPDRFYIADVLGCEVVTEEGEKLGIISDVTPAATDIYVVDNGKKSIPFAAGKGVITDIDTAAKKITVNRARFNQVALLD